MNHGDFVRVVAHSGAPPLSTRQWLTEAHAQLESSLPRSGAPAILTEDLADRGAEPTDVLAHFGLRGKNLRSLWDNWRGLLHSSQSIGGRWKPGRSVPKWNEFAEVAIPVTNEVELAGRLGFTKRNGRILDADCIVLLPGLFGHNGILRTRDLAAALRASGVHVLALEVRGHGQTELLNPNAFYTYGAVETVDLLLVSEWLEGLPHVRRTGLVGFCWGANLGLLAAWYDANPTHDVVLAEALARGRSPSSLRRHFTAGIVAFSPVLHFEELLEELDRPKCLLRDPVLTNVQNTIRNRFRRKHSPKVSHSLGRLVAYELARSRPDFPGSADELLQFLRFRPYGDAPAGDKLTHVRVPVLIVAAANDPLSRAQDVSDLMADLDNQDVAALILPGGGHVGFAPYARSYYYSLLVNFFDRATGPAGALNRGVRADATRDRRAPLRVRPVLEGGG